MNQDYTSFQNEMYEQRAPVSLGKVRLHTGLIAFAAALVVVISSVVQLFVHEYLLAYAPAVLENDWFPWVYSTFPMYFVSMPLAYLLLRLLPSYAPQKQKTHPLMWVGFLLLCFAVSYASNYFGQYVSAWLYEFAHLEVDNELLEMTSLVPFGVNLLFVGILAPVFEELFYRKVIIDRLRRYGDLPAILISGLIFGLMHGNLNQIFYAVTVGMLLGFIYVRTGNVLYSISIHAAFNMIGGVYTTELIRRLGEDLVPAEGDTLGTAMLMAYSAFIILSLVGGVIFYLFNIKRFHRSLQKGEYTLRFDSWMNVLVINPGMWAFLAMVALMVAVSFLS